MAAWCAFLTKHFPTSPHPHINRHSASLYNNLIILRPPSSLEHYYYVERSQYSALVHSHLIQLKTKVLINLFKIFTQLVLLQFVCNNTEPIHAVPLNIQNGRCTAFSVDRHIHSQNIRSDMLRAMRRMLYKVDFSTVQCTYNQPGAMPPSAFNYNFPLCMLVLFTLYRMQPIHIAHPENTDFSLENLVVIIPR